MAQFSKKILLLVVLIFSVNLFAQASDTSKTVKWEEGPTTSKLGDIAEISIPEGYIFADEANSKVVLASWGNQITNTEKGLFGPKDMDWVAVFEYDNIGYVPDDEKESLDADELMEMLKEGNEAGNKWRKENGIPQSFIVDWHTKPNYNETTKNLEWAVLYKDEYGGQYVNLFTKLLGRGGVMNVTFVADDTSFAASLPVYREKMKEYSFVAGHKYAEYVEGDKLAEYGLTGLIVGGGVAALAAKSGLLKHLWKFVVGAAVAGAAFFKKIWARITGNVQEESADDA